MDTSADEETLFCHSCKTLSSQLLKCSRCKNAFYCSKACQISHWKDHKPRCKLYEESKKKMASIDQKRGFRLFQRFRDAARYEGLSLALVKAMPNRASFLQQPSELFVLLKIKFDYNCKSFVPVEPPIVGSRADLPQDQDAALPDMTPLQGQVVHLLYVTTTDGLAALMPIGLSTEMWSIVQKTEWELVYDLFRKVKLSSTLFASFPRATQSNIKLQLQHFQKEQAFSGFVSSALQMNSPHPLQHSKLIVVDLELGFGLGEIKKLASWKLKTPSQVTNSMESHHARELKSMLDLSLSAPILAKGTPGSVHCPVLFQNQKAAIFFVLPNLFVPPDSIVSIKKCQREAQKYFSALQALPLPSVESPPIE